MTAVRHRGRQKQWLRLGLVVPLLLVALVGVKLVSGVMSSIVSDQATTAIFNDAAELPPELINSIQWLPDEAPETYREMEPLTRVDLAASWIRAWEQLRIASEAGDISGVDTYFANSARIAVLAHANEWDGRTVQQLGHNLQLTFYSEDGQIVGLRSTESHLRRSHTLPDGSVLTRETSESYEAILVLDDGNWRIHHWVRRGIEPA